MHMVTMRNLMAMVAKLDYCQDMHEDNKVKWIQKALIVNWQLSIR